jgi:beta-glucanase (GH16 family)
MLLLALQLGAATHRVDEPLRRPPNAHLVFADTFANARLSPNWRPETERNKAGWYNNERQYYVANRAENLRIQGGRLIIEARADGAQVARQPDYGRQLYTSARLTSRSAWTYGFYEVRAKLPCGRGLWPAIWMLPQAAAPWPAGGEIDLMEQVGWRPHVIHATLHSALYNHARGTQRGAERRLATDCTRFHRYQLDWRPDSIRIGLDGRAFLRVDRGRGGAGAWPFDKPFRLLLNLAVGGDWGGQKGIDPAAFPARLEIDHVRIWQPPVAPPPRPR